MDTGWSPTWIFAGLSVGLLVAGMVSPLVGRTVAEHGGRPVLAFSTMVLATGLGILGLAANLPVYLTGWLRLGLGMGCCLYDPAFATLGRLYGSEARPAITTLTLSSEGNAGEVLQDRHGRVFDCAGPIGSTRSRGTYPLNVRSSRVERSSRDATDEVYRQAITAAGVGCMAALEAGTFSADRDIGESPRQAAAE